ncbi:MAG TPA: hypothetical protein VGC28_07210 [Sphingomonas sp.]
MSHVTATIIGLIGSAIFVAAFAYANVSRAMDKRLFNAMNLVGAILLLISLSVDFNLPAAVLESMWGIIALIGLIAAIRGHGTPQL